MHSMLSITLQAATIDHPEATPTRLDMQEALARGTIGQGHQLVLALACAGEAALESACAGVLPGDVVPMVRPDPLEALLNLR